MKRKQSQIDNNHQNQSFQNKRSHQENQPEQETVFDLYRKMGEEEFNRQFVAPENQVNSSEEEDEVKEKDIHRKMTVSSPEDQSEIEADNASERIMMMNAETSKSESRCSEQRYAERLARKERFEKKVPSTFRALVSLDKETLNYKLNNGELREYYGNLRKKYSQQQYAERLARKERFEKKVPPTFEALSALDSETFAYKLNNGEFREYYGNLRRRWSKEQHAERLARKERFEKKVPPTFEALSALDSETFAYKLNNGEFREYYRNLRRRWSEQKVAERLARKENDNSIPSNVSARINEKRGTGNSLSDDTLSFMEPRFGADFSGVKVHNDSDSHAISKHLNAKAFAVGRDVFFAQGQYNPHSYEGKKLMAHELTHVMQSGKNTLAMKKKSDEENTQDERFNKDNAYMPEFNRLENEPFIKKIYTEKHDLPLIKLVGVPDKKGLIFSHMYQYYMDIENEVQESVFSTFKDFPETDNKSHEEINKILNEIFYQKRHYKVKTGNAKKKTGNTIHIYGHAIKDSEIETLLSIIRRANSALLSAYYQDKKKLKEYNDALKEKHRMARARAQQAADRLKNLTMLIFQGKVKPMFDDKEKENERRQKIYELSKKAYDIVESMDELGTTLDSLTDFKEDPSKHIQTKYLSRIGKIKSYVDFARNWKKAESGIPVEENLATVRNTLSIAEKIPGPHSLLLSEYIIPVVDKVSEVTNKLVERQVEQNKVLYQLTGEVNNTRVFPGGDYVDNFMEEFWKSGKKDNNILVDKNVIEFFEIRKDKFKKFIGSQMPDPGKDPLAFKEWVRYNKNEIWVLLYGSRVTPDKKGSLGY